jgi:hypothetical protein
MSHLLPTGYLSLHEAAHAIARALFAGVKDQPAVLKLREKGFDVADGLAVDAAIVELWLGVDHEKVEVMAYGADDRRLRMDADLTKQVPLLRHSRGGDFTYLRPGTSAYDKLIAQFGPNLGRISLLFLKRDVEKLAKALMQRRRRLNGATDKPRRGRPSRQAVVASRIREVVDDNKWNPTLSLKALTTEVERRGKLAISEDTVARVLDQLYKETKDRRFQRVLRKVA